MIDSFPKLANKEIKGALQTFNLWLALKLGLRY